MSKIGEIQRSAFEKIAATLMESKGKQRIDIRVYALSGQQEPDNWLPTKKAISLTMDDWKEFKALVDMIDQTIEGT